MGIGIAGAGIKRRYTARPDAFPDPDRVDRHDASCTDIWMKEETDHYAISAKLPTFRKEDIYVSVDGKCVTLAIQRPLTINDQQSISIVGVIKSRVSLNDEDFRIIRTFFFENAIDVAKAQAIFRNGVLELILPKSIMSRRLLIN